VVLDDFLPADVVSRLVDEFPSPASGPWAPYDSSRAERRKFQLGDEAALPPFTRQIIWAFNSAVFLRFLSELSGIEGLLADPSLWGGGLHQTGRGGCLAIHADFHRHPNLEVDRRLNLLFFLNPVWGPEWGGALELWARDMSRCVQSILPLLNRCVIFSTSDSSFHGHPEPLACPEDVMRRSLALYYYSNGRPADEVTARRSSTLFRRRPGTEDTDNLRALRIQYYLQQCIPPILIEVKRRLFGRSSERRTAQRRSQG
jgi:hypothetical protein